MQQIRYIQTTFHGPYHDGLVQLRLDVFVEEQKVPEEIEIDERDEKAVHYVALDNKRVIGTLRVIDESLAMRIGRLAVDPSFRHQGIASRLMELALDYIKRINAERVVLDSQITAIPFYERFGFVAEGEIFDDGGIDHMRMTLCLVARSQ